MGGDDILSGRLLHHPVAAMAPWALFAGSGGADRPCAPSLYMFAIEIWPQEFYFVAGLLIMAGIGLFLVTSAVGRAWCGYACPQTVWTDLFQHVDRLIDGDRNAQMKLAKAPWGPAKITRRLVKWSIYLLISISTGGMDLLFRRCADAGARICHARRPLSPIRPSLS
jgi:hypothetical protein